LIVLTASNHFVKVLKVVSLVVAFQWCFFIIGISSLIITYNQKQNSRKVYDED